MTYRYTKLDDGEGLDGGPRYEVDDIHGFTICVVDDENTARLFSASLDLLEALGLCEDALSELARLDDGTCSISALYATKAAIAKAKGDAS
jgi:hypothetical protein